MKAWEAVCHAETLARLILWWVQGKVPHCQYHLPPQHGYRSNCFESMVECTPFLGLFCHQIYMEYTVLAGFEARFFSGSCHTWFLVYWLIGLSLGFGFDLLTAGFQCRCEQWAGGVGSELDVWELERCMCEDGIAWMKMVCGLYRHCVLVSVHRSEHVVGVHECIWAGAPQLVSE